MRRKTRPGPGTAQSRPPTVTATFTGYKPVCTNSCYGGMSAGCAMLTLAVTRSKQGEEAQVLIVCRSVAELQIALGL